MAPSSRSRRRRAHAYLRQNAIAFMALFVALSGTGAYAANEWTGANIVDETLTGYDVRGRTGTEKVAMVNGSLTGLDISGQPGDALGAPYVNGSLTTWDLADGSVRSTDLLDSGVALVDLAPSARGVRSVYVAGGNANTAQQGQTTRSLAFCPAGMTLLSGGYNLSVENGHPGDAAVSMTRPLPGGLAGWEVEARNVGGIGVGRLRLTASAVCGVK